MSSKDTEIVFYKQPSQKPSLRKNIIKIVGLNLKLLMDYQSSVSKSKLTTKVTQEQLFANFSGVIDLTQQLILSEI